MSSAASSKVWFVTGASRGLGRDLAIAVLAAGHRLAATARNPADLADIVAAHPGRTIALPLDVTDAGGARAALATAREKLGGIDVVVNNAGYATFAELGRRHDRSREGVRHHAMQALGRLRVLAGPEVGRMLREVEHRVTTGEADLSSELARVGRVPSHPARPRPWTSLPFYERVLAELAPGLVRVVRGTRGRRAQWGTAAPTTPQPTPARSP